MNIHSYFASLPTDTRYYLLDHANELDKIKEVVGDKAEDTKFINLLAKLLNEQQLSREQEAGQRLISNGVPKTEIPFYIINALQQPFTKHCEMCGRIINTGKYCNNCAKEMAKKNYV